MPSLVTRFHLLLLTVTLALTGVGLFRIPEDFVYLAHWQGNVVDWSWPREVILGAPVIQVILLVAFFLLGRALTRNHFAKTQHILDPALTLIMSTVASSQLGLLLTGIGSDLDFVRFTAILLGLALLPLGVVLFEAERHTYACLRMPWPIRSDAAWRISHAVAGITIGLCGLALLICAWLDVGLGVTFIGFGTAVSVPVLAAGIATLASDRS
jgi:uncharacterized membrane protein